MTRVSITLWLSVFYLTGGFPLASAGEWKELDLESAEISFIGDDSFVKKRQYKTASWGSVEAVLFSGGFLEWMEMLEGWGFDNADPSEVLILNFNGNKAGLTATIDDRKYRESGLGEYSWISKSNKKASCMNLGLVFGLPTWKFGGNQRIIAGTCWANRRPGTQNKLESFMHDLMDRIRLDEGAINKMKAAGKYPESRQSDPSPAATAPTKPTVEKKSSSSDIESRLLRLKKLEEKGLITKEDAAEKRKKLLEKL